MSKATFLLNGIALVWWCRRYDDVRRGSNPINTLGGFKRELKKQFHPEDVEYEARVTLRCL